MSAREIIAMSTHSHACDGGYSVVGGAAADAAISALTAAGYRILAPGELDQVTLEKAAAVAGNFLMTKTGLDVERIVSAEAAIRALKQEE